MLISKKLDKCGIIIHDVHSYQKVKKFVQHGNLVVSKAVEDAENEAASIVEIPA